METKSLTSMFSARLKASGPAHAVWRYVEDDFCPVTWSELGGDASALACGLWELGIRSGDRVAHLSENRYEWIVTDLAILALGAVHVPIHAPLTASQVAYQVAHSGARLVIVSTAEQLAKLNRATKGLPDDLTILAEEPCFSQAISWWQLVDSGDRSRGFELLSKAAEQLTSDDVATILYTSGTTGEPKGVVLTHGNLVANTQAMLSAFGETGRVRRLSFLPLSHIFARTCDLYSWIASGTELVLARSRDTVFDDCARTHPTWINGVPYFYERIWRVLRESRTADEPGSVRKLLGGSIEICCAGGAALSPHVFDYFSSQGVPVLEGYGLSETSPAISISTREIVKRECVGKPLPGVDVRIAEDGEILTRGPHVMREYFCNPLATAEVLRNGWFHTGDLGSLDEEGFLRITGRKKELIVTSGGKNIAPVLLESLLRQDSLILQAMVIGDSRSYLTALIVPDWDLLRARVAPEKNQPDGARLGGHSEAIMAVVQSVVSERLSDLAPYEQVRRFTLLDRPFTIESGELTPKLTLRRQFIEARFAAEIAAMYASQNAIGTQQS